MTPGQGLKEHVHSKVVVRVTEAKGPEIDYKE